jgi:DNA-binding PadR family transcriptional regulator
MSRISTTAYAMLGLLSLRSWSSYEIAQYMKLSNLRAIWPRAESQVYKGPARLEKEGLAASTVEFTGERKRTVHRITRAGRAALRKWLGQPSKRFAYRSEALVKISFGDCGTIDELRRNIEAVRREAEEDARVMLAFAEGRGEEGPLYSQRTHVNALVAMFILDLMEARIRWARSAERLVRDWETTRGDEGSIEQGNELWAQLQLRLTRLLAESDRSAA